MAFNPFNITEIELSYKNEIPLHHRPQLLSNEDAANFLQNIWNDNFSFQEEFNIVYLNRNNRVLGVFNLAKGTVSNCIVDIKLAFVTAIKANCSSLIFAHNHPSGNKKPSISDIALTEKFEEVGKLLDINIVDHIILTPDGEFFSFALEDLL